VKLFYNYTYKMNYFKNFIILRASFGIIVTIYSIIIESSNSKEKDVYANSFFAICCFISLFFVIFFVRETKDTPLEEVDNIFGNKEKSKQK